MPSSQFSCLFLCYNVSSDCGGCVWSLEQQRSQQEADRGLKFGLGLQNLRGLFIHQK